MSDPIYRLNNELHVDLQMTCGAAPVQIEGEVDGFEIYFRSRGSGWSFEVYGRDEHKRTDESVVLFSIGYSNGVGKEFWQKLTSWEQPFTEEQTAELMRLHDEDIKHPQAFEFSFLTDQQVYDTLKSCIEQYRMADAYGDERHSQS